MGGGTEEGCRGVCRVPGAGHEEEAGCAMQGTRRLQQGNTLERHDGPWLSWRVGHEDPSRRMSV